MIFLDDNNQILEAKGDIAITKQAVSFFGFKIKGDVSVNFTVPNNSETRKVLNYNGPQMTSQVAFTRQSFNLMDEGNIFMRGCIVIQNETDKELDCYFVSGNSNWINLLNGLITTLDFSSYRTQITYANVYSLISATSGITFPMVDWCYNLKKGNNEWQLSPIFTQDRIVKSESFYPPNNFYFSVSDGYYSEFYPCFFLSSLVSEIFQQNGLKTSGSLFSDPIFNRLIITPYQGQILRDSVPVVSAASTLFTGGTGVYEKFNTFVETYDPENLFSSSRYTASRYCVVTVTLTCVQNIDDHVLSVSFRKNNVDVIFFGSDASFSPPAVGEIYEYQIDVTPGDYIEVWVNCDVGTAQGQFNLSIQTNTVIGYNDYITPNDFLFPNKQIDIIKFIINYFGCVATFDEYSKTVKINIIDKIQKENAQDWSEYYISHRSEYTVNQAQNNFVKMLDPDDSELTIYNKNNQSMFGGGNITTDNQLKYSNDLFTIPFAPSLFGQSKNGNWITNIGLINLEDGDSLHYDSITDGTPKAKYQVLTADLPNDVFSFDTFSLRYAEIFRITNSSGDNLGYFLQSDVIAGSSPGYSSFIFRGLNYSHTEAGTIYRQKITFNEITPRLLLSKTFTSVSSYNIYESGSINSLSNVQYAFFAKKFTDDFLDTFKVSASWGEINDMRYTDPNIRELYFRNISKILNNPTIRAQMLLPKSVYQSFDFSSFIYIKSEKLTGYFFVDSIVNYQDASTPGEVNLYML